MARENIDRRLVAILSADVVGYSRLMGIDEAGTLAALRAHRAELIDPMIAEHNGRIVKLMGDGLLVEFASATDAVECAVAVQNGMAVSSGSVCALTGSASPMASMKPAVSTGTTFLEIVTR